MLARHGFARKQEWKLEEQGDNMVALEPKLCRPCRVARAVPVSV
ncbi:MAG: hypothetical protein ACLTYW_04090 [Collinsella sp.]